MANCKTPDLLTFEHCVQLAHVAIDPDLYEILRRKWVSFHVLTSACIAVFGQIEKRLYGSCCIEYICLQVVN